MILKECSESVYVELFVQWVTCVFCVNGQFRNVRMPYHSAYTLTSTHTRNLTPINYTTHHIVARSPLLLVSVLCC